MAGIDRVARGHVELLTRVVPALDLHLHDGTHGTLSQYAGLTTLEVGDVDHLLLLVVPALQHADTDRAKDTQVVVAKALGQLLGRRVPHRLAQLELGLLLAVGVDRLLLVEIDAVGTPLRLDGGAVVVQLAVHVILEREEGILLLIGVLLVTRLPPHLGIGAGGVLLRRGVLREGDGKLLRALHVGYKGGLREALVELRGDLLAIGRHDNRLRPGGHFADHHGAILTRVLDRHAVGALLGLGAGAKHRSQCAHQNDSFHVI